MERCAANLYEAGGGAAPTTVCRPAWWRVLKAFHQVMVTTLVDKASHNMAHVCVKWYQRRLKMAMRAETYERSTQSVGQVLDRIRAFNDEHDLTHVNQMRYLYMSMKLQKERPGVRTIAGTARMRDGDEPRSVLTASKPAQCTTAAEKRLNAMLGAIVDKLRDKDVDLYQRRGVRRLWFIESLEQVALPMKEDEPTYRGKRLLTADCANMYTELRHETLMDHVIRAMREAREWVLGEEENLGQRRSARAVETEVLWEWHRTSKSWRMRRRPRADYREDASEFTPYSVLDFEELLRFVIGNAYVTHEAWEAPRRQRIGIPMGSLAAVNLANLYCYVAEASYVDGLVAAGELTKAMDLATNRRFVDDLLWTAAHDWPVDLYPHLVLSNTVRPDGSVVCLGVHISRWGNSGRIRMRVFDKEDDLKMPIIRYPHARSAVPGHQIAGVFKGQLVRHKTVCNNLRDFKDAVRALTFRMASRGHHGRKFVRSWHTFLRDYWDEETVHRWDLRGWYVRMERQLSRVSRRTAWWTRDGGPITRSLGGEGTHGAEVQFCRN